MVGGCAVVMRDATGVCGASVGMAAAHGAASGEGTTVMRAQQMQRGQMSGQASVRSSTANSTQSSAATAARTPDACTEKSASQRTRNTRNVSSVLRGIESDALLLIGEHGRPVAWIPVFQMTTLARLVDAVADVEEPFGVARLDHLERV